MNIDQHIEAAKNRNSKSEKALFLHFTPKVFLLCRRYAGNEQDAHDFLQECWLVVFQKIRSFDPSKGVFEGWLHRVCTNVVLQILRKRKRDVKIQFLEHLPESSLEENDMELVSDKALLAAIDQLPDGYREVLNLIVFEKWSHRQIAEKLGISESTSRSQYSRSKQYLKRVLQEQITARHARKLA